MKHGTIAGVLKTRLIAKPVAGTLKFYRDGIKESSGWSVSTTAGLVTFGIATAAGIQVAADVAFDVPVRFDSDQTDPTIETYQLASRGADWGDRVITAKPPIELPMFPVSMGWSARMGADEGLSWLRAQLRRRVAIWDA